MPKTPKTIAVGFPERLLTELNRAELSPSGLARVLRVSKSHISGLLSGDNTPSPQLIAHMSFVFGCSPEWLETGEGLRQDKTKLPVLNSREQTLIEQWRKLSPTEKSSVSELIHCILRRERSRPTPPDSRAVKISGKK
jgi:transcriptional regulator with XRE-family HTH domain